MWGGLYKSCYTPDSSFGGGGANNYKEHVVNAMVMVLGVRSPCNQGKADSCLPNERWECNFGVKGESVVTCQSDLKTNGGRDGGAWGVTTGQVNNMTWTSLFGADVLAAGGALTSNARCSCTDATTPGTTVLDVTGPFTTCPWTRPPWPPCPGSRPRAPPPSQC